MKWKAALGLIAVVRWLRGKFAHYLLRTSLVLGVLLIPSYQLYDLENVVYDFLVKVRFLRATKPQNINQRDIVLILIDDEARRVDEKRRLVKNTPTSRSYLAEMIDKLAQLKSRPKVVGIDFQLDQPVIDPLEDETLALAIDRAVESGLPIVLGTVLIQTEEMIRPLLPIDLFLRSESVKLGFTNFLSSSTDGVVRRSKVSFPLDVNGPLYWYVQHGLDKQITRLTGLIQEKKIPHHLSFAAELNRASDDYTLRKGMDKQLGYPFWIDFTSSSNLLFRVYSSAHLLDDRLPTDLGGAIVILGSAYKGSSDRVPTPLSASTLPWLGLWGAGPVISQELPGAYVHAYAVHTLKLLFQDDVPFHVGPWRPLLIAMIIGALQAWIGVRRFNLLAVPESIVILALIYVSICVWLFVSHHGLLPFIRPITGYIFSFAAVRHVLLNYIQGSENAKEEIVE